MINSFIEIKLTLSSISLILWVILKLYPIFNVGRVLISTSPIKILATLRKIKCPDTISIGLVTALRYLSEIGIRIKEIRCGMRVRGLKASFLHPIHSFEIYVIPLIYKCLYVSETLTSSVISRGIEYDGDKTSYNPVKFTSIDYMFLILYLIIFVLWWLE